METLVYFGSHNLQKGIFTVSLGDWRSSAPELVQIQTPARANGDSVVNVRTGSKTIDIEGNLKSGITPSPSDIEEAIKQLDQIFNVKEAHYLRSVPDYLEIIPTDTATGWTASDDVANLALNTTSFQHGVDSLGFDIDVSADADNKATLTYTGDAYDLSAHSGEGNIEFWLNIPDAYYVTSVDFRLGNDSSNYYSVNFTTDYESNPISNGANLFSADLSAMTETGTVNDATLDYCVIVINYSASTEDVTGCYVDGIMWVNEDRVRNYPCFRSGPVERENYHYQITNTIWRTSFINHKGYAISTHTYGAFDVATTTTSTDDETMDLVGSIDLLPLFTILINTATQIDAVSLSNLSTGEEIEFNAGTLANGDTLIFGGVDKANFKNSSALDFSGVIPKFKPGHNRARLSVTGTSDTVIPAAAIVGNATKSNNVSGTPTGGQTLHRYVSQGFTTGSTNPITAFSFGWAGLGAIGTGGSWKIATNNAGKPSGTVVASGSFSPTGSTVTVTGLSYVPAAATIYHLCILTDKQAPFAVWAYNITVDYDSTAPYAGGLAHISNDWDSATAFSGITWTAFTGDVEFTVTQGATPAWDIDWSATYRKLYAA